LGLPRAKSWLTNDRFNKKGTGTGNKIDS